MSALASALDAVRAREDLRERRAADPVAFVHQFTTREDQELAALVCASCAFGNVKAIRMKLGDLFGRIAPLSLAEAGDDPKELRRRLRGFVHRVYKGEDIAGLLVGARRVQRRHGSLGKAFARALADADATLAPDEATREALATFCDRIRHAGGFARKGPLGPGERRGPSHLLSDVRAGGAGKRLWLFLRWMIRPADGIDLGLWSREVPPDRLLVPVDVHIHKLAKNLGLTKRDDVSWRTAVEITAGLRRLDRADPVKYDFSLCHMGMVQRCPSRRDPVRCEGCGVKPVCIRWSKRRQA